jgi:hypothetical protein
VVADSHAILRWLHHINEVFASDGAAICEKLELPFNSSVFKLWFGPTNLEMHEVNSKRVVLQYRDTIQIKNGNNEATT